jgi:hypothetical protein
MADDDVLLVRFRANADQYKREVDKSREYGRRRFREMQRDAETAAGSISKRLEGMFKPSLPVASSRQAWEGWQPR